MTIDQREWGRTRIVGGRHAFRQSLMLRELRGLASPPAEVLDAGCGDGALTAALLGRGFRVSAVDASGLCVERCRQAVGCVPGGLEAGKRVLQSTLTALPFGDAGFDVVVSGEVLEHVEDDAAAVREMFRVLRPGGVCVLTVPADPRLWAIGDEWAKHLRRYGEDQLRGLFTAAGFGVVSLRRWGWPLTYLYDRYVFNLWLKRRIAAGRANDEAAGGAGLAARALTVALSVDRLFIGAPWGIGLVGVFQKRTEAGGPG